MAPSLLGRLQQGPIIYDGESRLVFYFVLTVLLVLLFFAGIFLGGVLRKQEKIELLRLLSVPMRRMKRMIVELSRKSVHVLGAIVPGSYFAGQVVAAGDPPHPVISRFHAAVILAVLAAAQLFVELLRKVSPRFNECFCVSMGGFMRKSEHNRITAVASYLLGCAICVALFEPSIAIASMFCLILGDAAAALVGVPFGRTKMFGGKKSLEGTLAMFVVCFVIAAGLLHHAEGPFEIVALIGAIGATAAELYPVLGDDNLSVPVIAGVSMHAAAWRLGMIVPDL